MVERVFYPTFNMEDIFDIPAYFNIYAFLQRFQELEEEHICQMKDFVDSFAKAWENEHVMLGQVRNHCLLLFLFCWSWYWYVHVSRDVLETRFVCHLF